MNIERLQELRASVLADPKHLDMSAVGNPPCGSPGCLIGWTMTMAFGKNPEHNKDDTFVYVVGDGELQMVMDPAVHAGDHLGLNEDQLEVLFLASMQPAHIKHFGLTPEDAIAAIDSLIETGTPMWSNPDLQQAALLSYVDRWDYEEHMTEVMDKAARDKVVAAIAGA